MWLLGTELRISGRAVSALNHQVISPVTQKGFELRDPPVSASIVPHLLLIWPLSSVSAKMLQDVQDLSGTDTFDTFNGVLSSVNKLMLK